MDEPAIYHSSTSEAAVTQRSDTQLPSACLLHYKDLADVSIQNNFQVRVKKEYGVVIAVNKFEKGFW